MTKHHTREFSSFNFRRHERYALSAAPSKMECRGMRLEATRELSREKDLDCPLVAGPFASTDNAVGVASTWLTSRPKCLRNVDEFLSTASFDRVLRIDQIPREEDWCEVCDAARRHSTGPFYAPETDLNFMLFGESLCASSSWVAAVAAARRSNRRHFRHCARCHVNGIIGWCCGFRIGLWLHFRERWNLMIAIYFRYFKIINKRLAFPANWLHFITNINRYCFMNSGRLLYICACRIFLLFLCYRKHFAVMYFENSHCITRNNALSPRRDKAQL